MKPERVAPVTGPDRALRLLIMERDFDGHRMTGVRVLLDALAGLRDEGARIGSITLATTAAGFRSEQYAVQVAERETELERVVLPASKGPASPFATARAKLADWRALVAGGRFDHAYVPYGDGLVQLLGVAARVPGLGARPANVRAEAILMRGGFAYPGTPAVTRAAALAGLRRAPLDRIHLIDPLPWLWLREHRPGLGERVRLLPDPITPTPRMERARARAACGLDPSPRLRWVGCVGVIDERKGVPALVRAFRALADPDARLLLAGRQSERVRALLAELAEPRIVAIDRYLDEPELVAALNALDLVAAPYPRFTGSVSTVLRAVAIDRPTLGADTGWMGHVVPAFDAGDTCDVTDDAALAEALARALRAAPAWRPTARTRALARYGSLDNARAHWTALLRDRLGLPRADGFVEWPEEWPEERPDVRPHRGAPAPGARRA